MRFTSFTGGTSLKYLPAYVGDERDLGSIPGSGKSLGEGDGNPLQFYSWENPMDREPSRLVHGVAKELDMTEHKHLYLSCSLGQFRVVSTAVF